MRWSGQQQGFIVRPASGLRPLSFLPARRGRGPSGRAIPSPTSKVQPRLENEWAGVGRSHTNVCRVAQRKMELYGYAQRRTESHGDIRRRSTARGNARSHTEPGVALSRAVSPCIAQSRPKSSG
eukprot:gene17189-biopygen20351